MSLAVRGQPVRHFPTQPREVFDVSGAGDTTLAALGLALAAEAPIEDAIAFAQLAAGSRSPRSAPPPCLRKNWSRR